MLPFKWQITHLMLFVCRWAQVMSVAIVVHELSMFHTCKSVSVAAAAAKHMPCLSTRCTTYRCSVTLCYNVNNNTFSFDACHCPVEILISSAGII